MWLALRHGLVTIIEANTNGVAELWLALRHGLVTIQVCYDDKAHRLWLALRHGLVTIGDPQGLALQGLAGPIFKIIRAVAAVEERVSAFFPSKIPSARTAYR